MKMKIYLLSIICMLCASNIIAQTTSGIQRSYAYKMVITPGTVNTGDGGDDNAKSKTNIRYQVFIENKGPLAKWQTATVDGKSYKLGVQQIKKLPFSVGRLESTNKPIIIKVKNGNQLWVLDFVVSNDFESAEKTISPITLAGLSAGKKISYKISKFATLDSPEHY